MDFVSAIFKDGYTYLTSIVFYSEMMNQQQICSQLFQALIHNVDVPKKSKLIVLCISEKLSVNVVYRFSEIEFDLESTIREFEFSEKPYIFKGTDEKSPIYYFGNEQTISIGDIKKLAKEFPIKTVFESVTIKN